MGYTSIVCGVTGSDPSQKAALEAAVLAAEHKANLTYVFAVDTEFLKISLGGRSSSSMAEDSLDHLGGHMLDTAEQAAISKGVHPKKVLRHGPVLEVLRQVIAEERAELLVLGHENRTFFEKVLFKGSVEEHVEKLKEQLGIEILVVN
jgi:nucleotide-binding universal stress UspA family protein